MFTEESHILPELEIAISNFTHGAIQRLMNYYFNTKIAIRGDKNVNIAQLKSFWRPGTGRYGSINNGLAGPL